MSTDIIQFSYEGAEVRTLSIDGEPWFVLADLARVLGIAAPARLASRLDEGVRQTHTLLTTGGKQQMTVVSEAGMYEVVIRSDKPEAVNFRSWITGTVLPEIRRTGGFGVQKALTPDEIVHQALQITAAKVQELEAKVAEDAPKVEYVDTFVARDDCRTFADLAKSLGVAESFIRRELIARGWIFKKFIGERFSAKEGRKVEEWEYRCSAKHKEKFRLFPQHNAPRHHNNQYRHTLYVTPFGAQQIAKALSVKEVQ